jgi:WD40 repeat protein
MNTMNADPTRTWEEKLHRHGRQLLGLKVSPCGRFAFAGDFDGAVQRWDLANEQRTTLSHHQTWVQALACHPDRQRLFSTDYWGQIACWSYGDESPRPRWTAALSVPGGWLRAAVVSADGRHLATAGASRVICVWDCDSGRITHSLAGHEAQVYSLAFHPDGSLVSGDEHGIIKQWDLRAGRCLRDLDASALWHSPETTMSLTGIGGVRSLAISRDGTELACGGLTEPNSAGFAAGKPHGLVFDWARGTRKRTLKFREPFEGFVTSLVYHPDGFLIGAGGGTGGALWFWRGDQEEPYHTVKQIPHIRELDLHPDGLRLVAATFLPRGQGGNGRRVAAMGDYTDNAGAVRVYAMTPRPAAPRR